jgi:purine-binding chemotaxis protein CheW
MEIKSNTDSVLMGIVVDAVSEVLNIKATEIEDTPTFGVDMKTDFILGMAKAGGGVKILLDIDKVVSAQETAIVCEAA